MSQKQLPLYHQVLAAWVVPCSLRYLTTTAVNRFVKLRSERAAHTRGTRQYRYELREDKENPTDANSAGYDLSENEYPSLADDDNASVIVRWPTWAQDVMFVAGTAAFDSDTYGMSWV